MINQLNMHQLTIYQLTGNQLIIDQLTADKRLVRFWSWMENRWIIMMEDGSFINEFLKVQNAVKKYETYIFLVSVLYSFLEHQLGFSEAASIKVVFVYLCFTMDQLTN